MSANGEVKITKKQMDQIVEHQQKVPMLKVQETKPIKLSDKPGRGSIYLKVREDFGFQPEVIVVRKVHGRNNVFTVAAVVPDAVLLKEEKDAKRKESKTVDKGSSKKD